MPRNSVKRLLLALGVVLGAGLLLTGRYFVVAQSATALHDDAIVVDGHVHITNRVYWEGIDPWEVQATLATLDPPCRSSSRSPRSRVSKCSGVPARRRAMRSQGLAQSIFQAWGDSTDRRDADVAVCILRLRGSRYGRSHRARRTRRDT